MRLWRKYSELATRQAQRVHHQPITILPEVSESGTLWFGLLAIIADEKKSIPNIDYY